MRASFVLPLIVIAQFCGTSLWFGGNAVLGDLVGEYDLPAGSLGVFTAAVQLGFIAGTLVFAVLAVADQFSPSRVFWAAAWLGAGANLLALLPGNSLGTLAAGRFAVGFLLAGIYPVGMKIAADYFREGLGRSLGFLVGALVLGTAFPHLIRGWGTALPWRTVLAAVSGVAAVGGLLVGLGVADGPYRAPGRGVRLNGLLELFRIGPLRSAAFGYFGHMWELYAFWAFVPVLLAGYRAANGLDFSVALWSFAIIGIGGLGCVAAGLAAERFGARRTAATALVVSGACCLLFPLAFGLPLTLFLAYLMVWGFAVVADSPLFSTLVAQAAPAARRGTALTIVNCLGFAVTVVTILGLGWTADWWAVRYLPLLLAGGPVLGLWGFYGGGAGAGGRG